MNIMNSAIVLVLAFDHMLRGEAECESNIVVGVTVIDHQACTWCKGFNVRKLIPALDNYCTFT